MCCSSVAKVALHSRATVRKYGMKCITRLVVAALARHAKRRSEPAGGGELGWMGAAGAEQEERVEGGGGVA